MNALTAQFVKRLQARYAVDRNDMTMSQWVEQNTTHQGRAFGFKGYEFQRAIVDDMHPDLAVKKCSQIGLTEVQLRKFLGFLVRHNFTTGIFTLPNEKMFKRVSQTRISPLVEREPVFNLEGSDKSVRSMALIQLANSFGYVTGCTEGDATSIPADLLMHDEYDLSPMDMMGLFQSRLQNSTFKITQKFSTPTFTGFGIDAAYEASNQFEYMIQCASCNHHQVPDFDLKFLQIDNLPPDLGRLDEITPAQANKMDLINAAVVCEKCRAPLDLADASRREWVARYPDRTLGRGYWVRPFSTSRLSIMHIVSQLLQYKQKDYLRGWYNTVLGRPYTDGNSRLEEAQIKACLQSQSVPDISPDRGVWLGIDVGQVCHLVLCTDQPHAFLFEAVPVGQLLERVAQIDKTYRLVGGAIDRHPYTPTAEALRYVTNGRVLPVEYRGSAPVNLIKDEYENIIHAQMNRTSMIDAVAHAVRGKKLPMSGYQTQESVLVTHLRDMVRDEKPEEPAEWIKLTGNDHYFHALAFALAGIRLTNVIREKSDEDRRIGLGMLAVPVGKMPEGLPGHTNRKTPTIYSTGPL